MTIQEIIDKKEYIEFRNRNWSDEDINYVIDELREKVTINWIVRFLRVSDKLPKELLKPIIIAGINYRDVSYPKRWMQTVKRIYSPEEIDNIILEIVEESSLKIKCKATHLLYFNGFSRIMRNEEELGMRYIWNGQNYTEEYIKVDEKHLTIKRKRNVEMKEKRYRFLVKEFLNTNNILYRYYIYLEIREVHNHPIAKEDKTKQVMEIFNKDDFPKNGMDIMKIAEESKSLREFMNTLRE